MNSMRKLVFNWANIERIPERIVGIYIFWRGPICLYVGQAKEQDLKKRLNQHYSDCHNSWLSLWLQSGHKISFSYEAVTNKASIDAKERNRIRSLKPLTNITHNRKKGD